MKSKKYKSLKVKLFVAMLFAIVLGVCAFFLTNIIIQCLVDNVYLSDANYERRIEKEVADFQNYVEQNNLSSDDKTSLENWFENNPYQYYMIYNSDGQLEIVGDGKNVFEYNIDDDISMTDLENECNAIFFSNGKMYFSVMDYSEDMLYNLSIAASVCVAALVIFVFLLVFVNRIIGKISKLSFLVDEIATNDINRELMLDSNDEIGSLSSNIELMRESIIRHYEMEKEAQNSNRELITNMSHDLRTPLTAVIGYTEVIKNEENPQLIKECADLALEKAYQLKEMSDKLFKYFLVYDSESKAIDVNMETVKINLLLQQIIGEQMAVLRQQGYVFCVDNQLNEVEIKTDVLMLKRVFDNVFSNITKYADKSEPISIILSNDDKKINTEIKNAVVEKTTAQSNEIGIRSCIRIMQLLGGEFIANKKGTVFVSKILLNI